MLTMNENWSFVMEAVLNVMFQYFFPGQITQKNVLSLIDFKKINFFKLLGELTI